MTASHGTGFVSWAFADRNRRTHSIEGDAVDTRSLHSPQALSHGERVSARVRTGEGSLARTCLAPHRFCRSTHFADKPFGVLCHQPVRKPEDADTKSSEEGILRCVSSQLAGL